MASKITQPVLLTTEQAVFEFGESRTTLVEKRAKALRVATEVPGRGGRGIVLMWPLRENLVLMRQEYEQRVRERAALNAGTMEMTEAETRKKAADAEMAELKLAERRRELVTVSLYRERRATLIQGAKAQLLAIAPRLRARVGPEIAAMVDEEVNATLRAMGGESDGLPDSL